MSEDLRDFEAFLQRREEASRAYVRGDAVPLSAMVAQEDPATFFLPRGGYRQGAREVASGYERDATVFKPGGESSKFEVFQMAASKDIAYWTGLQHGMARMGDSKEAVPSNLRVTEIFRREQGNWKLVHRHADMGTEERAP